MEACISLLQLSSNDFRIYRHNVLSHSRKKSRDPSLTFDKLKKKTDSEGRVLA
jgi:hypothetical protein